MLQPPAVLIGLYVNPLFKPMLYTFPTTDCPEWTRNCSRTYLAQLLKYVKLLASHYKHAVKEAKKKKNRVAREERKKEHCKKKRNHDEV